ncbi:hypothetical protein DM02DRAFT_726845 [Periconia macrospinosa]|uniref:Uncharacterized protein n=1 Tax=Periconia macrospinosa TaxID=97972 RepID=A0A2V1DX36_9PLEO|nr:hypothetical protein DM02DRAFT_726845 [Periconia macrospinosa]
MDPPTEKRLSGIIKAPRMLDDLTHDLQRMSASMPPDNWDPEHLVWRIERIKGGTLVSRPDPGDDDDTASARRPAFERSRSEEEPPQIERKGDRSSFLERVFSHCSVCRRRRCLRRCERQINDTVARADLPSPSSSSKLEKLKMETKGLSSLDKEASKPASGRTRCSRWSEE